MEQFVLKTNLGGGMNLPTVAGPGEDHVQCVKCEGTFFAEVRVSRYKDGHYTVPGQAPHKAVPADFILLQCARCGILHEPRITGGNTAYQNAYQILRDELLPEPVVVEEQKTVVKKKVTTDNGPPAEKKK